MRTDINELFVVWLFLNLNDLPEQIWMGKNKRVKYGKHGNAIHKRHWVIDDSKPSEYWIVNRIHWLSGIHVWHTWSRCDYCLFITPKSWIDGHRFGFGCSGLLFLLHLAEYNRIKFDVLFFPRSSIVICNMRTGSSYIYLHFSSIDNNILVYNNHNKNHWRITFAWANQQ